MEYVTEPARELPVVETCDVFVAGGGIAGAAAALAAARGGAKVLLCERECLLGGLGTLGIVTIYLPLCDGCGRQVSYGISEELLRLSIKHGAEARYPTPWLDGGTVEERAATRFEVQYNAHLFAIELERLLLREGVSILYTASVCGVTKQDGRIDTVLVEHKGRPAGHPREKRHRRDGRRGRLCVCGRGHGGVRAGQQACGVVLRFGKGWSRAAHARVCRCSR